jgi:endonuclease/exonuclease/phosphatase family metal-dependent hydrolase
MRSPPWTVSVATYNLLCDAYIRPEHYPLVAPADFLPANRHPRLDARVATLGTDVICTQETDHATFMRHEALLRPKSYRGRWAHRPRGKTDGCATFVRDPWRISAALILEFEDRPPKPTNRVALVTVLAHGTHVLIVANTHFEWYPDDAAKEERHGLLQADELLAFLRQEGPTIVCGDLNAAPGSEPLLRLHAAGFADPHPASLATFNGAGRPAKLDHLLHTPDLVATAFPTTLVGPETPLPSAAEPSDHVPLIAEFSPTGA